MDLKEFCKKNIKLSIYGCGKYGQALKAILDEENIVVDSFIISDEQEIVNDHNIDIPIYQLSKWKKGYSDCYPGILVSVSFPFQVEIISNLKKNNISNYYIVSELEIGIDVRKIGVMDTTISAVNHGNEIIMQAVYKYLQQLYEKDYIFKFPHFDDFGSHTIQCMKTCQYLFLGGTNALNSQMDTKKYIGINEYNVDYIRNKVVLMGVGWRCYEGNPNKYTQELLFKMLDKQILHSVRDSYTEKKIKSIGIKNVINTGCPTLWGLSKAHCKQVPLNKSDEVIMMMTPRDIVIDKNIVKVIRENYRKIYFWIQNDYDFKYIKKLCPEAIQVPSPLDKLENFLEAHISIDYVGTRLHGGIKCLQHKKRSVIIAIDNRAIEMKRDFNLPVVLPDELESLDGIINSEFITDIHLPEENIRRWLHQFDK